MMSSQTIIDSCPVRRSYWVLDETLIGSARKKLLLNAPQPAELIALVAAEAIAAASSASIDLAIWPPGKTRT
jgi:hypothetical protein